MKIAALLAGWPAWSADAPFTRDQIAEELEIVYKAMRRHHPNVFAYRTSSSFDELYRALRDGMPERLDVRDAFLTLTTLSASICDENTYVMLNATGGMRYVRGDKDLSPYFLITPQTGYSIGTYAENSVPETRELKLIAGVEPQRLYELLYGYYPANGCVQPAAFHLNNFADPALADIINAIFGAGEVSYEILDPQAASGKEDDAERDNRVYTCCEIERYYRSEYYRGFPERSDDRHGRLAGAGFVVEPPLPGVRDGIIYGFHEPLDTAYLAIDTFTRIWLDSARLKRSIAKIRALAPRNLILDLTGNLGESWPDLGHLLRLLGLPGTGHFEHRYVSLEPLTDDAVFSWYDRQSRDDHRKTVAGCGAMDFKQGICVVRHWTPAPPSERRYTSLAQRLYILIDPRTGGSALALARILRRDLRTKVIGATDDSATESVCEHASGEIILPHTGMTVHLALQCMRWADRYTGQFYPDVALPSPVGVATELPDYREVLFKYAIREIIENRGPRAGSKKFTRREPVKG